MAMTQRFRASLCAIWLIAFLAPLWAAPRAYGQSTLREVRGVRVTADDDAISTGPRTAEAMKAFTAIGLNTVYVDAMAGGYTRFPSDALKRAIGVDRSPAPPGVDAGGGAALRPARDFVEATLIEAHRNGLICIAAFDFSIPGKGGTAGAKDGPIARIKPEWLVRDGEKGEGTCSRLNILNQDARRFMFDVVLDAIDRFDLDGVQVGEQDFWPGRTAAGDAFATKAYAKEHEGREPPAGADDPEWIRWRAAKATACARLFVGEVRSRRPGLLVSLALSGRSSPGASRPPNWVGLGAGETRPDGGPSAKWDQLVGGSNRPDFEVFKAAWAEELALMNAAGGDRSRELLAGIRLAGGGVTLPWPDVQESLRLARRSAAGGHVFAPCGTVLDTYPDDLRGFYDVAQSGDPVHPFFGPKWRTPSAELFKTMVDNGKGLEEWNGGAAGGTWQVIGLDGDHWRYMGKSVFTGGGLAEVALPPTGMTRLELVRDRRPEMAKSGSGWPRP